MIDLLRTSASEPTPIDPALSQMMDAGIADAVFPGGALVIRSHGAPAHASYHGRTAQGPSGTAVSRNTCFDLASLTKVLATTPLVLRAVHDGALRLDQRVCEVVPAWRGQGRNEVTVRMLLDHSSGLAAWRRYYEQVATADVGTAAGLAAVRQLVASELLEAAPGTRAVYSDVGFILLDWILDRVHGRQMDAVFADHVVRPLGLTDLFFVDLKSPAAATRARKGRVFAATEDCPWRQRVVCGEVHDENAYAMGGVSGHAGLFGTAEDVARLGQAWLDSAVSDGGIFRRDLVQNFWRRSGVPGSTRTLGFDTPSPGASQAGSGFGPRTVGHLGYAGTSLWIDPDRELVVVLLTNRVHPTRKNDTIKQFRPALHNAVAARWPD